MRTYVYSAGQNPALEFPAHFASRKLAALVLSAALAKNLSAGGIQLLAPHTWAAVKLRFRNCLDKGAAVLPHDPSKLRGNWVETYPPVARGLNERERQLRLWALATRF